MVDFIVANEKIVDLILTIISSCMVHYVELFIAGV